MRFLILAAMSTLMIGAAPAAAMDAPAHIGRHTTTIEDQRQIRQVVADFQTALKTKDIRLLSSLMLHSDIEFVSPPSPEAIRKIREAYDPNANGLRAGGFRDFARFIRESKVPVEERFYNLKITQDKHVAWVMFDYEFVEDGKVWNYGIETWQMMKNVEGKWKIGNVWWTTNLME
ncbi:YybH family protein [Massilia sp. CMS3.1]|uniref:YybH family protein n=1 Tax=Massilia sp. CMS3.1 TaxID=3373083 RepID=UPI003EE5B04D